MREKRERVSSIIDEESSTPNRVHLRYQFKIEFKDFEAAFEFSLTSNFAINFEKLLELI